MSKFSAVILSHQIRSDKTATIKISVTHRGRRKYIDSGLVLNTSDLTKTFKIKTQSFIDSSEDVMRGYRSRLNDIADHLPHMSVDDIVDLLTHQETSPQEIDFVMFSLNEIERLRSSGHWGVSENHQTALNALIRYVGRRSLNVSDINVRFLQGFEVFIRDNPVGKSVKTMSRAVSLYMSSIRALHNELKRQVNDEDLGIIPVPGSPFLRYKIPTADVARKRSISPELIRAIHLLPYATPKSHPSYIRYNLAKDCLILSFCLMGINSVDLFSCDNLSRSGWLTYNRKKTASRRSDRAEISIRVLPIIEDLIKKYRDKSGERVFNFYQHYSSPMNFNQAINKGLKLIGKDLEIPDLEFYCARHSFASIGVNKTGIDKFTIHSALNHTNEKMRVTDLYVEKDFSLINEANKKIIDFVFNPPESDHQ